MNITSEERSDTGKRLKDNKSINDKHIKAGQKKMRNRSRNKNKS